MADKQRYYNMQNETFSLAGKVALVTGAGSGIGRASAIEFARAGAKVVVSDIDEVGGGQTVQEIMDLGGEAKFIACNVADSQSVSDLIEDTVKSYGSLDCALNNAGIEAPMAPIADASEEDWDRALSVNLKGVWLCMRAELRQMVAQGSGAIVNTSSQGGLTAVPLNGSYSAAKHGVIGLTKTAAVEYAEHGIRVNAICPGFTKTPMTDRIIQEVPAELVESTLPPMKRAAEPREMAGTVVFLCSPAASYLTGQAIAIDGGGTAI